MIVQHICHFSLDRSSLSIRKSSDITKWNILTSKSCRTPLQQTHDLFFCGYASKMLPQWFDAFNIQTYPWYWTGTLDFLVLSQCLLALAIGTKEKITQMSAPRFHHRSYSVLVQFNRSWVGLWEPGASGVLWVAKFISTDATILDHFRWLRLSFVLYFTFCTTKECLQPDNVEHLQYQWAAAHPN